MLPLILLTLLLPLTLSFNIDLKSPYIVKSDADTLFGFSVALHINSAGSYLLIGAPVATTSQPGISAGGGVYKCLVPSSLGDPTLPLKCSEQVPGLDDEGNKWVGVADLEGVFEFSYDQTPWYSLQQEEKSRQWLGVTITSTVDSDYFVACAHRYETRYLIISKYRDDPPRQLTGKCVFLDRELEPLQLQYEPCKGMESGYEKFGNCQAGTSAFLLDNNLVMGAPGCFEGAGCLFMYDVDDLAMNVAQNHDVTDQSDKNALPYDGYSSAICDMNDDGVLDLVTGGPRGARYHGRVIIYQPDSPYLTMVQEEQLPPGLTLTGEQMGSYYGASLLCQDMTGDGIDDLVVGAPSYSIYLGQGQSVPDIGRIYIYPGAPNYDPMEFFPFDEYDMEMVTVITGTQEGEAFGFALSTAGDINNDGLYDMLVGSPYWNDGEGRVSLFLGQFGKVSPIPSQVISPTDLGILDSLRGFGWSLAGGKDMDGNGISDVLIGAHKSSHAVLLRSIPVIDIEVSMGIVGGEDIAELDPLGEPSLETPDGKLVQGLKLQACFQYVGARGADTGSAESTTVNFQIKLDSSKDYSDSRLYTNYTSPTQTHDTQIEVDMVGMVKVCTSAIPAYFRGAIGYSAVPIEFSMSAELGEAEVDSFANRAVLNQQLIFDAKLVVPIASDCPNTTGICQNEMRISIGDVKYQDQHKYPLSIGLVKEVTVPVSITNLGPHTAYGTKLLVNNIPGVLPFLGPGIDCNSTYLEDMGDEDLYFIDCDLPIQLEDQEEYLVPLLFDLTRMTGPRDFDISMKVTVLDPSVITTADGHLSTSFSLEVQNLAQLVIRGGSSQERVPFNNQFGVANKFLGYEGPSVRHIYEITLNDMSINRFARDIVVSVYWPKTFPDGAWLFPLSRVEETMVSPVDANVTSGEVSCNYTTVSNWDLLSESLNEPDQIWTRMSCRENRTLCEKITCKVEYLERGGSRLKLSFHTKVEEYFLHGFGELFVESYAELESVESTMILPLVRSTGARTLLYPSSSKSRNLLWYIVAAVIGGIIIIAILIFVLWKVGFFKRVRPEPTPPMTVGYKTRAEDEDEYFAHEVLLPKRH